MIPIDHHGNTVLITGGCKGIGAGIAEAFAQAGANVVADYRSDSETCQAFAASLRERFGANVIAVQADVSRENEVVVLYDQAEAAFGNVDILINNAGSVHTTDLKDLTDEEWECDLANNVTAYFLMIREFARRNIPKEKGGRIVNILSKSSYSNVTHGRTGYVANKTGELGLTRAAAVELHEHQIYVNGLVPGLTLTSLPSTKGPEFLQKIAKTPMKRACEPIDVGMAAAFMTSADCPFMVGSIMDVSGGLLLGY